MDGDIKSYGKGPAIKRPSTIAKCGRLNLKATSDMDAAMMAMLSRTLFNVGMPNRDSRLALYRYLRTQMSEPELYPEL